MKRAMERTALPDRVTTWLEAVTLASVHCRLSPLARSAGSEIYAVVAAIEGRTCHFILRRIVMADWLRREPDLIGREAAALDLVSTLPFSTPRPIAWDLTGERTGVPAILMTRIDGHPWPVGHRPGPDSLAQLAQWLRLLHESRLGEVAVRRLPPYRPHHWPAITAAPPPSWSRVPELWQRATTLVGTWQLRETLQPVCLLHRDYRLENVLWNEGKAVGVVDWITACHGDPSADLGHCRWNLCRGYGLEAMHSFSSAYGLAAYDPLWDLLAAVGGSSDTIPAGHQQATNIDAFVAQAVSSFMGRSR